MARYRVKISVWKSRILPILKISGWEEMTEGDKTYMVNEDRRYRFEYRNYGNSAPVSIMELEEIG